MKLIYKSRFFSSFQCDTTRCFYVDFGHKKVSMNFCQLLSLRHKVSNIDISTHFEATNSSNIELLSLCNREHLFVLDTLQILDLKELLKGTLGMLELNSLIVQVST